MSRFYDVVVIGAGPAGIFTALELADTGVSVLILEKGLDIRERIALNRDKMLRRKTAGRISFAAGAARARFPTGS